jgi:dihydrodipicolinate synthase/N-acetylneuraminate lyase
MSMVGLRGGAPRAPLLALDDAERAAVRAALEGAGVPVGDGALAAA